MSDTPTTNGNSLPRYANEGPHTILNELTARVLVALRERADNALLRRDMLEGRGQPDRRRNLENDCGYPQAGVPLSSELIRNLYEREPIASRVVEVWPKECWQVSPILYEDDDPNTLTPFEQAVQDLNKTLRGQTYYAGDSASEGAGDEGSPLWEYLSRADELSGIGRFGVILLGLDDGLRYDEPVKGFNSPTSLRPHVAGSEYTYKGTQEERTHWTSPTSGNDAPRDRKTEETQDDRTRDTYGDGDDDTSDTGTDEGTEGSTDTVGPTPPPRRLTLRFLRVFPEHLVNITRFESDPYNPRFGQPVQYQITLNDPRIHGSEGSGGIGLNTGTINVHWSRVIHLADVHHKASSSETFAYPRLEPVVYPVLDCRKIRGSSAETHYLGAFGGISFETLPQLGGDVVVDESRTKDMIEEYFNGLQRWLLLKGMTAKSLAPAVSDPTPQINVQIDAICIALRIPVRVFKGSERGELASSQDDAAWNDRVRQRQITYLTPRVIIPFFARLISLGVLPVPAQGFKVSWPDITSKSDSERATIALQVVQSLAAYVSGGVENVLPLQMLLTKYLRFTDDEAKMIQEELGGIGAGPVADLPAGSLTDEPILPGTTPTPAPTAAP